MNQVVLVDYMNCYYRGYYVFPELFNIYEGEKYLTGSLFYVLNTISFLKRKYNCPVIIVTEPDDNSERYQINKDYKAGRSKKDPAIFKLRNETLRAASLLKNVAVLSSDDSGEADDIMFTFIQKNASKFDRFYVLSADNDLLQIAGIPELEGKVFYAPKNKKDPEECLFESYCQEKYSLPPSKILLYKSIFGDSSDNLPSCYPRLLKKFVIPWINQSSDLGNFKKILEENKENKYADRILSGWKTLESNYKIVTLKTLKLKNITGSGGKDKAYFINKYNINSFAEME